MAVLRCSSAQRLERRGQLSLHKLAERFRLLERSTKPVLLRNVAHFQNRRHIKSRPRTVAPCAGKLADLTQRVQGSSPAKRQSLATIYPSLRARAENPTQRRPSGSIPLTTGSVRAHIGSDKSQASQKSPSES